MQTGACSFGLSAQGQLETATSGSCVLLAQCGKTIQAWSCSGLSLRKRLWATGNPRFSAYCYPWELNLFHLSLAMLQVKKQSSLVWAPTPTCGLPSCPTSDLPDHYGLVQWSGLWADPGCTTTERCENSTAKETPLTRTKKPTCSFLMLISQLSTQKAEHGTSNQGYPLYQTNLFHREQKFKKFLPFKI